MKCPHCHQDVETPEERRIRLRREAGQCPRCGRTKTKRDDGHRDCFVCRKKNADRMKVNFDARRAPQVSECVAGL